MSLVKDLVKKYSITAADKGYTFKKEYGVSPQDHSRGKGGFEGEYFTVPGITDKKFETEDAAVSAIRKKFPSWKEIDASNMSGRVFKHPNKNKYLVTYAVSSLVSTPEGAVK